MDMRSLSLVRAHKKVECLKLDIFPLLPPPATVPQGRQRRSFIVEPMIPSLRPHLVRDWVAFTAAQDHAPSLPFSTSGAASFLFLLPLLTWTCERGYTLSRRLTTCLLTVIDDMYSFYTQCEQTYTPSSIQPGD